MKFCKSLFIVLVLFLSFGCAALQPYTAKYLPPVTCETKGLTALYFYLEDAQDVVNMFAREENIKAVAFTTKLGISGRANIMLNETITVSYPVNIHIMKVKTKQGEEGYMLKASLDCGAK